MIDTRRVLHPITILSDSGEDEEQTSVFHSHDVKALQASKVFLEWSSLGWHTEVLLIVD